MRVVLFLAAIPFAILGLCILLIGAYAVCTAILKILRVGFLMIDAALKNTGQAVANRTPKLTETQLKIALVVLVVFVISVSWISSWLHSWLYDK